MIPCCLFDDLAKKHDVGALMNIYGGPGLLADERLMLDRVELSVAGQADVNLRGVAFRSRNMPWTTNEHLVMREHCQWSVLHNV